MNDDPRGELPPLSDTTIERMERAVFDVVEDEPRETSATAPPHRARRRWITGLGIAAAFAIGAMVSPALLNLGSSTGAGSDSLPAPAAGDSAGDGRLSELEGADSAAGGDALTSSEGGAVSADTAPTAEEATADREIITTAELSVVVADVEAGAKEVAEIAAQFGGYVEASEIGGYNQTDASMPAPIDQGTGWVSIRIPADDLTDVTGKLDGLGEVTRSSISRQDVTAVSVDLQARIDAAQTSVDRLTELMSQSGSVGDLIAAETALTERQAQLESYQQELKSLQEQVAMSTISVQLSEQAAVADADPAGFTDGLLAGWNGLVATLNGLVIGLGFLLPWLLIAGVVILVIWLVRRHRRTQRSAPTADAD